MNNFLAFDVAQLTSTELGETLGGGFFRDLGYSTYSLAVEFKEAIIHALTKK